MIAEVNSTEHEHDVRFQNFCQQRWFAEDAGELVGNGFSEFYMSLFSSLKGGIAVGLRTMLIYLLV